MARWAGVQKVSRPIVRCQEMSQVTPTITLVEAKRTAYRNHGTVPLTIACAARPVNRRGFRARSGGLRGRGFRGPFHFDLAAKDRTPLFVIGDRHPALDADPDSLLRGFVVLA